MSEAGWISVVDWRKYQHYQKGEHPPWVKVYTRLLHDDAYLELNATERAVLHGIWLEYASSHCRVKLAPSSSQSQAKFSTSKLARRLNLRIRVEHIEALVQAGFIEIVPRLALVDGYSGSSPDLALAGRAEETETYRAERDLHQEGHSRSNGTEEALQSPAAAHEAAQPADRHVCEASTSEGDLCGASFDTLRALAIHRHEAHQLGLESMPTDVEELVERWSGETA